MHKYIFYLAHLGIISLVPTLRKKKEGQVVVKWVMKAMGQVQIGV